MRGRKVDWEQVGTDLGRPARECEDKFKELKSTGKRRKSTVQPVSTSVPLDKKTEEKLEVAIAVCYASKDSVGWDTLAKDMDIPILRMLSWAKDTQSLFQRVPMVILDNPREWTDQRKAKIKSFIGKHFGKAIDWGIVSLYMSIDEFSCAQMYTQIKNHASGVFGKANWSEEKKERLKAAVAEYPPGTPVSWVEVLKKVGGGRSNKHCYNYMHRIWKAEAEKDNVWTNEELGKIEKVIGKGIDVD